MPDILKSYWITDVRRDFTHLYHQMPFRRQQNRLWCNNKKLEQSIDNKLEGPVGVPFPAEDRSTLGVKNPPQALRETIQSGLICNWRPAEHLRYRKHEYTSRFHRVMGAPKNSSLQKGGDGRVTGPTDFSVRYLLACNRGVLFVATKRWGAPYTKLYLKLESSNWVSKATCRMGRLWLFSSGSVQASK